MKKIATNQTFRKPSAFWNAGWWLYKAECRTWFDSGRQGPPPQFKPGARGVAVRLASGHFVRIGPTEAPGLSESPTLPDLPSAMIADLRDEIRKRPRQTEGPPKRQRRLVAQAARLPRGAMSMYPATSPKIIQKLPRASEFLRQRAKRQHISGLGHLNFRFTTPGRPPGALPGFSGE
jgi:hypothetical protein